MERRDFIKIAALAGLGVASTSATAGPRLGGRRRQAAEPYAGPFFVMVNAGGGWDPTHLCDPKGAASAEEVAPINNYLEADIEQAGNIRYAPVGGNAAFFQAHYERLLVINGIDMQTNGHDSGSRNAWSGRLTEGHPSFAAYVAAASAPELPMSFLSFGGYDFTAGSVARTRSGNIGALSRLAYPGRQDPEDEMSTYHSTRAQELIKQAQGAREQDLLARQQLPRIKQSMNVLFTARTGANELQRLQEFLPDELDNSGNQLIRQAQVGLAAYRAGISVSTCLNVGGFDTHGNHDATHIPRLQGLLEGVDFLLAEAERQGVENMVVVVGSDFGRTPGYNDQQGKDHWAVGSMMLTGPGIPGNRVIGGSTDGHKALNVDPGSLEVVGEDSGVAIQPAHIHRSLRGLAGFGDHDLAAMFPLNADDLPLFG